MSQLPTNDSAAPLRIGIVEDDSRFAARLIEGIQKTKDLSAVGHYVTGQAALEALASLKLQLVLVDLKLPGMGGIEFIRRTKLLWPDLVTVVLTQLTIAICFLPPWRLAQTVICSKRTPPNVF